MIRRPPRSTLDRSSAASDVYKRQARGPGFDLGKRGVIAVEVGDRDLDVVFLLELLDPVSYTHLRAHETVLDLVCRLLLEKKNKTYIKSLSILTQIHIRNHQHITLYNTHHI